MTASVRHESLLSELDLHLFNEGTHGRLYERLGAHTTERAGVEGTHFAVWAPNARSVSVVGDMNDWDGEGAALAPTGTSGIWEGFLPRVGAGAIYKYRICSAQGEQLDKADPFAFAAEEPPRTASVVHRHEYRWGDDAWMRRRGAESPCNAPMSTYELHLGSWRRHSDGGWLSYRDVAQPLADYVVELGFTHVELMPITEHPFYGSWGYQTSGYFAPTRRYGTPEDLMYLIDVLHQRGIGVLLDWVPSHFPSDAFSLAKFDGTHLYEHADPRQGHHPDWDSAVFNYSRHEVRSFLLSSALYWIDRFHIDGLRVDAVASMLYLDYSRKAGEWIPNRHGGRENLEAIELLQLLTERVRAEHPGAITVAEESTAWPMVSRPAHIGGLGFDFKWDMGWMHDTLAYLERDPIHRRFHHDELTFRAMYQDSENFVLPLSHDEVVHGKGSLVGKMPGDEWRRFANLRLMYGQMYAAPGKKLLFMGAELAQVREWSHERCLDWHLLDHPKHRGIQDWVRDLNHVYRRTRALHELDGRPEGFEWVDCHDAEQSVIAFLRKSADGSPVLAVFNATPVPRHGYRLGVPVAGAWRELLNSDAAAYGGSGVGNFGGVQTEAVESHGHRQSLTLSLPPLGALLLQPA